MTLKELCDRFLTDKKTAVCFLGSHLRLLRRAATTTIARSYFQHAPGHSPSLLVGDATFLFGSGGSAHFSNVPRVCTACILRAMA